MRLRHFSHELHLTSFGALKLTFNAANLLAEDAPVRYLECLHLLLQPLSIAMKFAFHTEERLDLGYLAQCHDVLLLLALLELCFVQILEQVEVILDGHGWRNSD